MIAAARIPFDQLPALAALRADPRLRIYRAGDRTWIRWPAELFEAIALLRPVPQVEFFEQRGPHWHRAGRRLASSEHPPSGDGESLSSLLRPSRFQPLTKKNHAVQPIPLSLRRGGPTRPATALSCTLNQLRAWAELATTMELQSLRATQCEAQALLLGAKLPAIPSATRFWGERLLLPLGYRLEQELPVAAVFSVMQAGADDLVFVTSEYTEIVPKEAFQTLSRAGVRRVCL
jgi:hypothetical protein